MYLVQCKLNRFAFWDGHFWERQGARREHGRSPVTDEQRSISQKGTVKKWSYLVYSVLRGRRKISSSFQASYFFARQGARACSELASEREDSRSYLTDEQRSMAEKEPYQMGKLFFSGPLSISVLWQISWSKGNHKKKATLPLVVFAFFLWLPTRFVKEGNIFYLI